jgi:hypothetical protein
MSTFAIPNQGALAQPNEGEFAGNLIATAGVDLSTEKGRILSSASLKNIFDESDDADFDNPVSAFEFYNGTWWGSSDVLIKSTTGYPDSAWSQDATASSPTGDWKEMDMEVFNGLLLVSGTGASADDIFAYNGSAWSSWWKGTLAQTALDTTTFKPMKLGATGRLYILDSQTKVYNVTSGGTPTKTGNGTLDFSATTYRFICMEASSTKLWIGGTDTARGTAVLVEWDMSLNSATANKVHKLPSRSVQAIAIWNDNPIAVLSNGELHSFNGSNFEKIRDAHLPKTPSGFTYKGELSGSSTITVDSGIIHPNGWGIVDGLPHFFFNTQIVNKTGTAQGGHWNAPAGIWCYDPDIGLYCRYVLSRDFGTADTNSVNVTDHGAITFVGSGAGDFLVSSRLYSSSGSTSRAVLLLQDGERSLASRAWFATTPIQADRSDVWQSVELLHKKLSNSSDRIFIKYRLNKSVSLPAEADITWSSANVFTSTDADFANVVAGDEITVLRGNGAGLIAHVTSIAYSAPTYTVDLDDSATGVSATNTGRVRMDNWKRLTTVSAQNTDYSDFSLPFTDSSFKLWLKFELRTAAGSRIELDKVLVNSKSYK